MHIVVNADEGTLNGNIEPSSAYERPMNMKKTPAMSHDINEAGPAYAAPASAANNQPLPTIPDIDRNSRSQNVKAFLSFIPVPIAELCSFPVFPVKGGHDIGEFRNFF